MARKIVYGLPWPENSEQLEIEMAFVRAGGRILERGIHWGYGLFHHMRAMMDLLWPDDDHHRWSDLMLQRKCENDILVMMGASDSNKTYSTARYVLCDYWAHSDNTLWLVSSTELRGSELRIWGKIKELFNRARERYPWLAGKILESKTCITSEEITRDGSQARLFTKGIIFIPCKTNNRWIGLGAYAGIKPTKNGRLGHAGDEVSFMERSFLDAYANWYGKPNFQGILDGNPTDLDDPLCTAAEPTEGWSEWKDTEKTQEWRSRFYNAWVIAYDGRDSPNFDFPPDQPIRFPYLISRKKIDAVKATEGDDHPLYWMQCIGKPMPGAEKWKVISRQLCENNRAFDKVVWESTQLTHVVSLDAAYGGEGGDRCELTHLTFGREVGGLTVIAAKPQITVPIAVKSTDRPEKQITLFCKSYCEGFQVPPEHFFFDGRATLAVMMSDLWSPKVNVVDFGGPATDRPVSKNHYIWDDEKKERRLKRCNEHYNKFVTELWFTIYYLILSKQMRELPRPCAEEGCKRLYRPTKSSPPRIEVETKKEMKERTSESPDLFDSYVTGVEGCRRLGFQIEGLANVTLGKEAVDEWLDKEIARYKRAMAKSELKYATN